MKNLKNTLLSLIDNGATQAKGFIENFNDLVESFDMESQLEYFNDRKKELIKRSNELFGDFSDLLKDVKESISDFSVTVPFDKDGGEKIGYNVSDNKLNIEVSYEDETTSRSNKTSVLIPNNCDLEHISLLTNALQKTATVTIPKKVNEPTKENGKTKKKVASKKNTAKKKAAKEEGEETTRISSKLAQKLKQNGAKYSQFFNRDSSGRFVRRTPKTEN